MGIRGILQSANHSLCSGCGATVLPGPYGIYECCYRGASRVALVMDAGVGMQGDAAGAGGKALQNRCRIAGVYASGNNHFQSLARALDQLPQALGAVQGGSGAAPGQPTAEQALAAELENFIQGIQGGGGGVKGAVECGAEADAGSGFY